MPVDPQIAAILELMASAGAPSLASGSPEQARAAFRFTTVDMRDPANLADVASIDNQQIPGPAGSIPVRIYRPAAEGPVPTIVFFHGGGFVIGDLDTHDDHGRLLCRDVNAVVVSVDYRLAPEHKFPAGFEDCFAATQWAADSISSLGGDAARLAVAGDSAGGNLAAAVALAARERGPSIAAQLLIYPGVDFTDDDTHASRIENAEGYFLTADDMVWFREHYIADEHVTDPRASVLHAADLSGVAPAVIGVGEYDPLRDEGEAYAKKLSDAGVEVTLHRFDGMVHGFYGMGVLSAKAADAVQTLNADLRKLLANAIGRTDPS
ncbi:MAG TPA: alpha/beta hydrolase [Mycobacteriales bacterium]|nr:alpha/beta hydrolase [Mycobacteriales bacterium]